MFEIKNREDLINETIQKENALLDGSPNLRGWYNTPDLYVKLHPNYNNELENKTFYPESFADVEAGVDLISTIENPDVLNEVFNTDFFKKDEEIKTYLRYQSYDGMPVGTFTITVNEEKFSLSTYNKRDLIEKVVKAIKSNLIDKDRYTGKLSEKYAFSTWDNYSQSRTYYKAVDMGLYVDFIGYDSMEKLEDSIE